MSSGLDTRACAVISVAALFAVVALQKCSRSDATSMAKLDDKTEIATVQSDDRDSAALLAEVGRRSKAILYTVSNKTNDAFSIAGLTKYLRMKKVEVHEGATPEETILVNARRLLELLDRTGNDAARPKTSLRHALLNGVIDAARLQSLFPEMKQAYMQQPLDYGRNSRYGDKWKISCYLVVMENWKPKLMPHEPMVRCMNDVMYDSVRAFESWYCKLKALRSVEASVMNAFVTRYRPIDEENQLKKHIDGANVDGSVILALPTDDPFHGGRLHVWDSKPTHEYVYDMLPGDVIFLDNGVWHEAKPISSGTRWALVLFLKLKKHDHASR